MPAGRSTRRRIYFARRPRPFGRLAEIDVARFASDEVETRARRRPETERRTLLFRRDKILVQKTLA